MRPIDIIIPVWQKEIPDCLFSTIRKVIENTTIPFNLIIVASNDSQPKNINRGLRRAKSKYVAILDWDIEVEKGWLKTMIDILKKDKKAGVIGAKMTGKYSDYGGLNAQISEGETKEWLTLAGGCMVFRNIGIKFDESFTSGYWADTDFCRQYKEKGYKILITGKTSVKHHLYHTTTHSVETQAFMKQNEFIYKRKWGDNEF